MHSFKAHYEYYNFLRTLEKPRRSALRKTTNKAASDAQSTARSDAPSGQSTGQRRDSLSRLRESALSVEEVKDSDSELEVVVDVKAFNEVIGQHTSVRTIDKIGKQGVSSKLRSKFKFGEKQPGTPKSSSSNTQRFDIFTPNRVFNSKIINCSLPEFF